MALQQVGACIVAVQYHGTYVLETLGAVQKHDPAIRQTYICCCLNAFSAPSPCACSRLYVYSMILASHIYTWPVLALF